MHLYTRNVNDAFYRLCLIVHSGGGELHPEPTIEKSTSRNGDVIVVREPVTVTFSHPLERVLINPTRDANPFFHVFESLWMLAGHNDVAPLAYYNSNIAQYSDNGTTFNAAYGHRWRHGQVDGFSEGTDQIAIIAKHLRIYPNSRRAVLQIWNVEDDLLKIGLSGICNCRAHRTGPSAEAHDDSCPAKAASRDVACNTEVMFSLRNEVCHPDAGPIAQALFNKTVLDMTVINRSNDMIWGMLGADHVAFSFLQEYMCRAIYKDITPGYYHHFSNNCHVYQDHWKPIEWLSDESYSYKVIPGGTRAQVGHDWNVKGRWQSTLDQIPLINPKSNSVKLFDAEVKNFVLHHGGLNRNKIPVMLPFIEPFLQNVAQPMCMAFHYYKQKQWNEVNRYLENICDDHWRQACKAWITKRNPTSKVKSAPRK